MPDNSNALVHAVSGCLGATAALGLLYPLDLLRTIRQAEAAKNKNPDGTSDSPQSKSSQEFKLTSVSSVLKMYKGFLSSISTQAVSFFVYFFAFRFIQRRFPALNTAAGAGTRDMLIAALAGGINVMITNPLWVASTEIKTRKHDAGPARGMLATLRAIYGERGIAGLWKGVAVSLVLVSNPAIQFAAYEQLKKSQAYVRGVDASQLSGIEFFLFGALAKAAATLVTYPLQVAQTILRGHRNQTPSRSSTEDRPPTTTFGVLAKVFETGGLSALYAGLKVKFVMTVLTSAFMFLCYEKILRVVTYFVRQLAESSSS